MASQYPGVAPSPKQNNWCGLLGSFSRRKCRPHSHEHEPTAEPIPRFSWLSSGHERGPRHIGIWRSGPTLQWCGVRSEQKRALSHLAVSNALATQMPQLLTLPRPLGTSNTRSWARLAGDPPALPLLFPASCSCLCLSLAWVTNHCLELMDNHCSYMWTNLVFLGLQTWWSVMGDVGLNKRNSLPVWRSAILEFCIMGLSGICLPIDWNPPNPWAQAMISSRWFGPGNVHEIRPNWLFRSCSWQ